METNCGTNPVDIQYDRDPLKPNPCDWLFWWMRPWLKCIGLLVEPLETVWFALKIFFTGNRASDEEGMTSAMSSYGKTIISSLSWLFRFEDIIYTNSSDRVLLEINNRLQCQRESITSGIESKRFGIDGLLRADAGRIFVGFKLSITGIWTNVARCKSIFHLRILFVAYRWSLIQTCVDTWVHLLWRSNECLFVPIKSLHCSLNHLSSLFILGCGQEAWQLYSTGWWVHHETKIKSNGDI